MFQSPSRPRTLFAGHRTRFVTALFLVTLVCAGCRPDRGEEASTTGEAPVLVEVIHPRVGSVSESISLTGDLSAENQVDLIAEVSGTVVELAAREGQIVNKGDLLMRLDPADFELNEHDASDAHEEALAKVEAAELDLAEAAQNETLRLSAAAKAQAEYQRVEAIVRTSEIPPLSDEEMADRRFALQEANTSAENAKLAHQRSQVALQLAKIAQSKAWNAWQRAKLELARTEIHAPLDGAVAYIELRLGEWVKSGTKVVELVNAIELYTDLRVPQRRLPSLRLGQPVQVRAETVSGRWFPGRIDSIHPTVDPAQGTVKVRIGVSDPTRSLRPGVYVNAKIELATRDNALLVPKRARVFDDDESVLFVVRGERALRVPIAIGFQNLDEIQVLPGELGLTENDQIVIRGQSQLRHENLVTARLVENPVVAAQAEPSTHDAAAEAGTEPAGESDAPTDQPKSRERG